MMTTEQAKCGLCGKPMPPGEEMFQYHGYSGPCPDDVMRLAKVEVDERYRKEPPPGYKPESPVAKTEGYPGIVHDFEQCKAERDALKAELAELKAKAGNIDYQRSLEDQLASLRAQASPDARKDFERLEWLCENAEFTCGQWQVVIESDGKIESFIDAIDAALKDSHGR